MRRMLEGAAVTAWIALAGCSRGPADLALDRVEPDEVSNLEATPVTVVGAGFSNFATGSVDGKPTLADEWRVQLALGASQVELPATRVDAEALSIEVPMGLELGLWSVTVLAPDGRRATLVDALNVVEIPTDGVVSIETDNDGTGQVIGDVTLAAGELLDVYSVLRSPSGEFYTSVAVDWSVTGGIGSIVSISPNMKHAVFRAEIVGTGTVRAEHATAPSDETGVLTVLAGAPAAMRIESAASGLGQEITDVSLTTDDALELHAAGYDAFGNYAGDIPVAWVVTGGIGAISPGPATSAALDPQTPGTGTVLASDGTLADASGLISVAAGRAATLTIAPDSLSLAIGAPPVDFSATAVDDDGNDTQDLGTLTWSIASGPIAAIQAATGIFTATTAGLGSVGVMSNYGVTDTSGEVVVTVLAASTAPLACLTADPQAAISTVTVVTFDASCSTDAEDAPAILQVRFDFQGDGTWDTALSTTKTATFNYPSNGFFEAAVEVRDSSGNHAFARRFIAVHSLVDEVVVTTAVDENDAGATPSLPLGAGFSLREAITWVNGQATPKTIRFAGPMTILPLSELPVLGAAGTRLVGRNGVVVDFASFSAGTGACWNVDALEAKILRIRFQGCSGSMIDLQGLGGQTLAECELVDAFAGVQIKAANIRVGPRNEISLMAKGVTFKAAGPHRVDGNRIHGCTTALDVSGGSGALIEGNVVYANDEAIVLANNEAGAVIRHNVVDGSLLKAISVANTATNVDLRNNFITNNVPAGVSGPVAAFAFREPNGFFQNGAGGTTHFSVGTAGTLSTTTNPEYVNRAGFDFRLLPVSPGVNRGSDLGLDVNGPGPLLYDGAAPDFGAHETPY